MAFKDKFIKALPTILVSASTAGVAGTAVLASKAGVEAAEARKDGKKTWPIYIPTAVCGVATVGCMWAAHIMNTKQIALLLGTCGYLAANRDALEDQILRRHGKEELTDVRKEVAKELNHKKWGKITLTNAEETGKGDLLCIEGYSGRIFRSNEQAVRSGVAKFVGMVRRGDTVCLNDLYRCLHIQETHFGYQYGWPSGEDWTDCWRDPSVFHIDVELVEKPIDLDEPVLCIDITGYPIDGWEEY